MGESKPRPSREGREGQTYVEIIAVIGLIAIALLVMVKLKTAQFKLGEQTATKTVAFNLTVEGLEITESLRLDRWINKTSKPYSIGEGNWVLDYKSAWDEIDPPTSDNTADSDDLSECNNCYLCQQPDDSFLKCSDSSALFKRMISINVFTTSTQIFSKVLYFEKTWKSINLERFLTEWDQNEI